jgi:predicted lipoprotein with Yx(FWY)xxD motif
MYQESFLIVNLLFRRAHLEQVTKFEADPRRIEPVARRVSCVQEGLNRPGSGTEHTMNRRIGMVLGAAAVTLLALAGCSSSGSGGGASGGSSPSPSSSSSSSSDTVLKTATTSLGTVLVDGRGLTVYVFDKDTKGATSSACSGACATQWPAVDTSSATPKVDGVTGAVGTITGVDGKLQVTVNGWPLYTFAGDSSAGDVTGQGVGGIWWAVGADGNKIGAGSSTAPTTGSTTGSSGYSK